MEPYPDAEASFPMAPAEAREHRGRFAVDPILESQPTDAGEEVIYGKVQEHEKLNTSVLDYDHERRGNLPSMLKGMNPTQRKIHICVCIGILSCIIFAIFAGIGGLLIKDS